jgi:hypothetical protein
MERRLYQICLENQITFVTISHRPALQAYHDQMLAIGDGKCGFTLKDIDRSAHVKTTLAMARASVISKDTEQSIAKHADARSQPYADMRDKAPLSKGPVRTFRKMLFLLPFPWVVKDGEFAKTGSGQTQGKLKDGVFSQGNFKRLLRIWRLGKPSYAYARAAMHL